MGKDTEEDLDDSEHAIVLPEPCGDCDPCLGGRPDQCAINTRFANKGHPMSQIDGDNNIDPPMSTHTDAEFEQVKVELALEKEKTVGLRWLDIQNDYIIVSLRSDAVSLASRLNEASREHDELRVTLAASHTQVARLKEALQCVMDECQKHYEHNPVSGRNRLPEGYQTVGGIAADAIDAATATAAQAGKERAT
jgi:hypothetical protein